MKCLQLFWFTVLAGNLLGREARESLLQEELPKLKAEYRASPIRLSGPETPLSRRYYALLNRYVRYTEKNLRLWPREPGAMFHKNDGSAEHAVRQNASVALSLAVLAAGSEFDQRTAGVPRVRVRGETAALLRYLSVTHRANFLPTGDGKPWGDLWQSAYWTALAGQAAWLMWDDLPDDTRVMVARMVIHEADRFNTRPPDSGEAHDTKAEENAWNSEVIALAACMFQQHPRADLWRERAIVWMANSYSSAADAVDGRILDGKPLKDRITTLNIHPDFTVENHGRVHPDYLSCFALTMQNAILYQMAGLEIPAAAFHHARDCNAVCLGLTATNGSLFYINGQDWFPHRHDVPLMTSGLLGTFLPDPDTAGVEAFALGWLERMHRRFDDGRAFDPREYNYPNAEEELMALYAENYLAHRLRGDFARPAEPRVFQEHQSGARIFASAGFVTHRTPGKFVSFCWVNDVMGLVYPADDTWFTAPYDHGLVGRIKAHGVKDTQPRLEAHNVRLVQEAGAGSNDGFVFAGRFSRCEGTIEQKMAVISLPGKPVIYVERLQARKDVTVEEIATASMGILNEDAKPITPNRRQVWVDGGRYWMRGAAAEPAKLHVWQTSYANVDDKLSVAAVGSGRMSYQEDHRYTQARLQQVLAANYLADVGLRHNGELISEAVVEILPNVHHNQPRTLRTVKIGADGFDVQAGDWRVLINLGETPLEVGQAPGDELPALSAKVRRASR